MWRRASTRGGPSAVVDVGVVTVWSGCVGGDVILPGARRGRRAAPNLVALRQPLIPIRPPCSRPSSRSSPLLPTLPVRETASMTPTAHLSGPKGGGGEHGALSD